MWDHVATDTSYLIYIYIEAAPRNPGPIKIIKLPGVEVGPHGIFGRLRGIQPWMSRMGELNGDCKGLLMVFPENYGWGAPARKVEFQISNCRY